MSNSKHTDHVLNILLLNNSHCTISIFVFVIFYFQFKRGQTRREGNRRTLFENGNKCVTSILGMFQKCFETADCEEELKPTRT